MRNDRLVNLLGAFAVAATDEIAHSTLALGHRRDADCAAVNFIGHAPGLSVDEIAAVMALSQPAAVRLVERLERDGLVEKRPGENHKTLALHLTSAGRAFRRRLLSERYARIDALLDALDVREREQFEYLLEKMLARHVRDEMHAGSICRLCDERICTPCPMERMAG